MKKTLLTATAALALNYGPACAGEYYAGVYGGANWDDVISAPFVKENTGLVIGGVVGKTIPAVKGLRIEADLSFRQNEVDIFGGKLNVDHDTVALLANAVYDIPLDLGPAHPYVLAGIGFAKTEAIFENISLLKLEASGVAWQLGTGVNVNLTADGSATLGVGYRYFQGPSLEPLSGLGVPELSDGSNHAVLLEAHFAL